MGLQRKEQILCHMLTLSIEGESGRNQRMIFVFIDRRGKKDPKVILPLKGACFSGL